MPRLDPLLVAMVSNNADALRLADGEIARLIKGGAEHPLTRNPLGDGQLALLLKEVLPPDLLARIDGPVGFEFSYENDAGRFLGRTSRQGGKLSARLTIESTKEQSIAWAVSGREAAPVTNGNGAAHELPVEVKREPAPRPVGSIAAKAEIEALLSTIVERSASDLHLRVGEPPIYRIHGELKRDHDATPFTNAAVEAMLFSIMPERNRLEYMESNDTDFAHEIEGLARFRANAFRDHNGSGGVFRVIPAKVATVEELGITPEVQNLCYLTKGLVLVTGPTGSGKSTTLGALVDLINRTRDDHVITIEDPIEFVHHSKRCVITQRQVGMHTGSFKSALRAALREDPDVVLVGELRDLETISIAIETAETGHLVFGTLHTTTAVGTVDRVIDQFPADRQAQIRVMLADTLKGVISQTLCKKIGGGRIAAREILLTLPAVTNLIREGKAFQIPSVMQTSRKLGMIQLGDVLIDLVDQGFVAPQEAYMKSTDKTSFLAMLKARGHDTAFIAA
ncbi:MAG: type IV pilus twitching motility protein PilT [Gemmatimonadales bacterium]